MKRLARRVAVVSGVVAAGWALVWFGGLNWLLADTHPVRNVLEGLSWPASVLALLVAVGIPVSKRKRNARPTNVFDGKALYLVDGRLPTVQDVDLFQLRVARAIATHTDDGRDLPAYVQRDIDNALDEALASGGLVLLHGQAASGKTRAAAEALRRNDAQRKVLIPSNGPALRAIVKAQADLGNVVVWLDDLERFLTADGLDLPLLQQLCPTHMPTTSVIGTMRDQQLAGYRAERTGDHAAAELIGSIPAARRLQVDRALSHAESARAKEHRHDARIAQALKAHEGFAEYLAAGPAMLERWSVGDGPLFHVGHALISAAVDCRRAGYHKPLPASLLAELHHEYLAVGWRDRTDLPSVRDALNWACEPVLGASSCLQPRRSDTYLAADYLLDRAQAGKTPLGDATVPLTTWNTLMARLEPEDGFDLGRRLSKSEDAHNEALFGHETASRASDGLPDLLVMLQGDPLHNDQAEQHHRVAAERGDVDARNALGLLMAESGRLSEAEHWYRLAADAGDTNAQNNLGRLLWADGRTTEAEHWYRLAADAGDTNAQYNLRRLSRKSTGR